LHFIAPEDDMRFANLIWAVRQGGSQFRLAAHLGESESWLSRRLNGHANFTDEERDRVSRALGYPVSWLFETPKPPTREAARPEVSGVAA
jgi:transcriptional regulator with XRE-family HTH domain